MNEVEESRRIGMLETAVHEFRIVSTGPTKVLGGFGELKQANSLEDRLTNLENSIDQFSISPESGLFVSRPPTLARNIKLDTGERVRNLEAQFQKTTLVNGERATVEGDLYHGFAINTQEVGGGDFSVSAPPPPPPVGVLNGRYFIGSGTAFEDRPPNPPPNWTPNWSGLWATAIANLPTPPSSYLDYPHTFTIDFEGAGFGCQSYKQTQIVGIRGNAAVTRTWWAVINTLTVPVLLTVVQTPGGTTQHNISPGGVFLGAVPSPQPEPPNPDININGDIREIQCISNLTFIEL